MSKTYVFNSILKKHLTDYIALKKAMGFSFDNSSYHLKCFDDYCHHNHLKTIAIEKAFINDWMLQRPTEGLSYRANRISIIHGFLIYLNTLGYKAYIPHHFSKNDTQIAHIMDEKEIIDFFRIVDQYHPEKRYIRLSNEYRVIFRLIYCCGLRNSEACNLKFSDIDLFNRTIMIRQSKNKDRIVHMSNDMTALMMEYCCYLKQILGFEPIWAFPSSNISKPFLNSNIDRKFNHFWSQTKYYGKTDKKPTVHSFRHSFVVRKMNRWMNEGNDYKNMLPYLCKYLGHSTINETFYYYHQTEEAFQILEKKDKLFYDVVPEVNDET